VVDLAGPSLLAMLSPADRDWLAEQGRRRSFTDGVIVHSHGDPDPEMAVVIAGGLRLLRTRYNGLEGMVSLITPGQHFADVLMFRRRTRTHRAIAQGATELDLYDHLAFARILERPSIVRALYQITAERLVGTMIMLDDVRSLSREAHLAKLLLRLDANAGGGPIACVQEDLAGLLGVTTMTVAKALRLLRELGLIETGYRQVRVLDAERLREWFKAQDGS
jgi:CRP/FNR family transcriptional regulator, cyclic AMP receptor protein